MNAQPETPRRLRAIDEIERLHAIIGQSLSRTPRVEHPDIEVGQEARTKAWYVKSLSVPMAEGEGWKPWLERVGAIAALALEVLPSEKEPLPSGLTDDEVPF